MKTTTKLFLAVTTVAMLSVTLVPDVFAAQIVSPLPNFEFGLLVTNVIGLLPVMVIIGLVGAVLTVAFTLIFSWGQDANAEPVKKVRKIAINAMIGFVIIAGAPFILSLVLSLLGVSSNSALLPFIR